MLIVDVHSELLLFERLYLDDLGAAAVFCAGAWLEGRLSGDHGANDCCQHGWLQSLQCSSSEQHFLFKL